MGDAAAGAKRPLEDGQFQDDHKRGKKRQKAKDASPKQQIKYAIDKASESSDVAMGFKFFKQAVAEGIALLPQSYSSLLHLCGVAAGVTKPRERRGRDTDNTVLQDMIEGALDQGEQNGETAKNTAAPPMSTADVLAMAQEIFTHMKESNVNANESSYTAL
eukprot:CAMPEP_0118950282 /NCGR_PEP_ID=MMETSP1169-20130426/51110_1 /TAXON_ID=36882 /ORGANISM="Pyramimonas obovata, Strain CCMP722" /LENGTH=160 /DNA_ID=CAMNT_0006897087 /DNA_START=86 /DNA_END=565 /DNA_ORIENTATION=+